MKNTERRDYSAIYQSRVRLFEKKYAKEIFNSIEDQYRKILEVIRTEGMQRALREVDYYLIDSNLAKILKELYLDVGVYFIKRYRREIDRQLKQKQSFDTFQTKDGRLGIDQDWISQILSYISGHFLEDAVIPITETSRNELRSVIQTGIESGWGFDEMSRHVSTLPRWRSLMLARTETARAAFVARNIAVAETDFLLSKEWIAAHDNRTRHAHALVDGTVIDQDAFFTVGEDQMLGPGDPTASAQNLVNCRCTMAFVPKRNAQGRLIPKN